MRQLIRGEKIVISIPADSNALIESNNANGLAFEWWLNGGSDYSSTGSFPPGWADFDSGARNGDNLGIGDTVGDEFAITGVQLEVGPVATPFEHRPIGTELALCQRYYQTVTELTDEYYDPGRDDGRLIAVYKTTMRAVPTTITQTVTSGVLTNTFPKIDMCTFLLDGAPIGGFANTYQVFLSNITFDRRTLTPH